MMQYSRMCAVAALIMGVAMAAYGAEGKTGRPPQTKTGVVKSADPAAKAIVVTVGRDLTFTITADTKILKGETPQTLADIKAGDRVSVTYSFTGSRKRVAAKITLLGAAAPGAGGENVPPRRSQAKTGTVSSVDLAAKAIVVMVTRDLTFSVTEDTQILQGETPRALADIKVGDRVSVTYSFAGAHRRVATKVLLPPSATGK